MTQRIRLYTPVAAPQASQPGLEQTMPTLAGKVVGFIDNAKPNFNFLVDDIAALLMSRYGVRQVIKRQKPSASVPVSEAMLAELVAQCDLVIAGSGD